jgi:hypothetical protein
MSETTNSESNKQQSQNTITVIDSIANSNSNLKARYLTAACSAGLCICFFMPWINIFIFNLSGYQFANQSTEFRGFWLVPGLAAITFLLSIFEKPFELLAILTAIAPITILVLGLKQYGTELLQGIQPGGWITLGLSVILLLTYFHKK